MAIISLKSLLGELLGRSCFSICAPKRDCSVGLIESHPLLALASPPGMSLTARRSRSFTEMSHSLPQKPVRFGLVTAAICFEPCDDVGIKTHRNGLLRWSIEFANFDSAPIDNRRSVREIKVLVCFCGDSSDVLFLLLCDGGAGHPESYPIWQSSFSGGALQVMFFETKHLLIVRLQTYLRMRGAWHRSE